MAQEQNYQVNYSINVDASQGTKQVMAFGEAVGKLVQAKASLTPAVTNIKHMMDEIDRVFRTKNGKKRSFDYRLTIDTKNSEAKLERVKTLLTEISTLAKGINLTIAALALDTKRIKANAKSLYEKKAAEARKAEIERNASSSVTTMADAQKRITKAMGKINSALSHMERGRELTIKTDVAEQRLRSILSILNRIKSSSTITLNISGGLPAGMAGAATSGASAVMPFAYSPGMQAPVPYAPTAFAMPEKEQQRLMQRLYTSQQLHRQRMAHDVESMNRHVAVMLKEVLSCNGIETILATETEEEIFGESFMRELDDVKMPHTKFQILAQMLRKAIKEYSRTNAIKGSEFAEKLQKTVDEYNKRDELVFVNDVTGEVVSAVSDEIQSKVESLTDELIELLKQMKSDKDEFKKLGISFEEKAFYDILVDTRNKHEFEYSDEKCIDLAKKIKELIDSSAMYADWINNNNIRNSLKNELIKLLYYNGYPPKWSADIFEKVLAQVENYKKNN